MTRYDLLAEENKDRHENIVDGRLQRAVALWFALGALGCLMLGVLTGSYVKAAFFLGLFLVLAWAFDAWARATWRQERYRPQWPRRFPIF